MNDSFGPSVRWFFAMALGGLAVTLLSPAFDAISSPDVPAMWWAGRALGLMSYLALWLSVLFGVFVAGRGAGGLLDRPTVLELHSRWAVGALVGTSLHVLAVIADPHSGVSPLAALIPLASDKLTGPVAVGTLALWSMATLGLTTALHKRIPRWLWRAVHATAFGAFLLALVHGVSAGSESSVPAVRGMYIGTSAVLLGAVIQRMLLAWQQGRMRAERTRRRQLGR